RLRDQPFRRPSPWRADDANRSCDPADGVHRSCLEGAAIRTAPRPWPRAGERGRAQSPAHGKGATAKCLAMRAQGKGRRVLRAWQEEATTVPKRVSNALAPKPAGASPSRNLSGRGRAVEGRLAESGRSMLAFRSRIGAIFRMVARHLSGTSRQKEGARPVKTGR